MITTALFDSLMPASLVRVDLRVVNSPGVDSFIAAIFAVELIGSSTARKTLLMKHADIFI